MVSSAVLGVATGTGLALVVAVTIVVYRYYSVKRLGKNWSSLDRWPDPPNTTGIREINNHHYHQHHSHAGANILDCWKKPQQSYLAVQSQLELACGSGGAGGGGGDKTSNTSRIGMVTGVAVLRDRWVHRTSRSPLSSVTTDSAESTTSTNSSSEEFNFAKEQHAVQPSTFSSEGPSLPHQNRSYPIGGTSVQGGGRMLTRNPSISSQGSLEGVPGTSTHRGSSPQIKAFGPDGRHHHHHELVHASSSYPPNRTSRSPSPARASSLDTRCSSPASCSSVSGTASPSQTSLSSLATGGSGTSSTKARCLSPLLIPPPRTSISEGSPVPPASPLGSIQPDLYQRRDGPLFLNSRRSGKSLGRLHLRLSYDFDKSDLHVHLIEVHDLAGSDQGGFNDPFVKLTLTPEVDTRRRQTKIHRNNPNPFFDEHFRFPVSYEELQDKTLVLQVFDYDRYSRNDIVGSVRVKMEELELVSSTSSVEVWGEIEREKKPPEEIQEVLLSLSYLPSAERLTVLILKARNLFPLQDKESLDPFVKVSLLSGDKRVKKRKTKIIKGTRYPVWNEAMAFNVPASSLPSSAIEICVLDASSELIGGNDIVGSCIVGPSNGGNPSASCPDGINQSREHWTRISQSPRKSIAMWHILH